jgi:hypothetical protein
LLDRNETLTWFVELLEKMKNADETGLKLMLCQIESVRFDMMIIMMIIIVEIYM